jgi:hypothetical protein
MSEKEILDRRQRAREAGLDAIDDPGLIRSQHASAIEAAIEVATRVKITPEVIEAGRAAWQAAGGEWTEDPGLRQVARLAASLRALGFEVVE